MVQPQKGSANKVAATMRVFGTVWHNHSESMERVIIAGWLFGRENFSGSIRHRAFGYGLTSASQCPPLVLEPQASAAAFIDGAATAKNPEEV
jgi:hypothetical protein